MKFFNARVVKLFCVINVLCGSLISPLEALLDYPTAAQRVLEHALALKLANADIGIKDAEAWQSALLPNPSISVQYDSFGGNNSYRGWGEADLSVSLSQQILLGGKRGAAMVSASYRTRVSAWACEIQKQDLLYELTQAFIEAALAQEKAKLSEQQLRIAQASLDHLKTKREKSKATLLELKKAEIALHSNQIALGKARGTLLTAKRKVASMWGGQDADFDAVNFVLADIQTPLPLALLETRLQQTPEILKAHAERWTAYSAKQLEKSKRVPDLDVSAGFSCCHHWDDYSFSFALGIPLPIFDCNQANICRAEWEEWQVIYGLEGLQTDLEQRLVAAHQKWQQAFEEAKTLQELSTLAAKEALAATEEDYRNGKVELDDLVDAQKITLDVQSDFIDAAAEYHKAKSEALRVVAGFFSNHSEGLGCQTD